MKGSRVLIVLVAVMMALSVSSCGCLGGSKGGEAKVETTTKSTTLGQELQDLDDAHKKGIISDQEYEKQKKELLKRQD